MRVLVVSSMIGTYKFMEAGVRALLERGHAVAIVAEGPSVAAWKKAGAELAWEGPEKVVPYDPYAKLPYTDGVSVDVMLIGTPSPLGMEQSYAHFANLVGLPLVLAEDAFGACSRVNAKAKLIITTNDISGRLIGESRHKDTPWKAVGSPTVFSASVSPELEMERVRLTGGSRKLVHYSGQGGIYTADILTKAVELMLNWPKGTFTFVVKHHPKGHGDEAEGIIKEALARLEAERPGTLNESSFGSDDLARIADFTFSCFGNALNVAAVAGRTPVSVWTPSTIEAFRKQNGIDSHPLFDAGLVALAQPHTATFAAIEWSVANSADRQEACHELSRKLDPAAFADAVESAIT